MNSLDQILGWIATILFSGMYVPQIIKTLKVNSVKDVSILMVLVGILANIIALIYALLINEPPLVIKYIIGISVTCCYLYIFVNVKNREKL